MVFAGLASRGNNEQMLDFVDSTFGDPTPGSWGVVDEFYNSVVCFDRLRDVVALLFEFFLSTITLDNGKTMACVIDV